MIIKVVNENGNVEFIGDAEMYLELQDNDSELPTMTELNDYIRFESETIFECLGLNEDGELEEE